MTITLSVSKCSRTPVHIAVSKLANAPICPVTYLALWCTIRPLKMWFFRNPDRQACSCLFSNSLPPHGRVHRHPSAPQTLEHCLPSMPPRRRGLSRSCGGRHGEGNPCFRSLDLECCPCLCAGCQSHPRRPRIRCHNPSVWSVRPSLAYAFFHSSRPISLLFSLPSYFGWGEQRISNILRYRMFVRGS